MTILRSLFFLILLVPFNAHAVPEIGFAEPAALPDNGTLVLPTSGGKVLTSLDNSGLAQAIEVAVATAKFGTDANTTLALFAVATYERVLLVEAGELPLDAPRLRSLGGAVAQALPATGAGRVSVLLDELDDTGDATAVNVALGLALGGYRFDKYKTNEESDTSETAPALTIYVEDASQSAARWADDWRAVAEGVYFARNLISEPANVIYPESFVERARAAFRGVPRVRINVLDEREMERAGMGSLLGVGMGSVRPPRLLVIEYNGSDSDDAPVVFAGKGVTFDTGGISIKGKNGLWRMKYDMSGAAAVTGTVLALAKRQAPVDAVAIAALVENMPSQKAQRPGDIRTSMSGKTIEVINTDAEGRLILADAVWYGQQEFEPAVLIDVATLTGSIRVALASSYAGLFSRHDDLAAQLVGAGAASGEELWRMPLHPDYVKMIKSDIADVKNSVEGGYGGASTGAEFIGTFVKPETRWAHLDIAGKAWEFEGRAHTPKGAAGWGVRLLDQFVRDNFE
jgi:leucyl aminopeptidase